MVHLRFLLISLIFVLNSLVLHAEMTIEIVGGGAKQLPIIILPFLDRNEVSPISSIIKADLERSGLFKIVEYSGSLPNDMNQVAYTQWRNLGAEAIVLGQVNGQGDVQFNLADTIRQKSLVSLSYPSSPAQARQIAHRIADTIYEQLIGDRGIFSTKIAYVVKHGKRYELQVADADGFNPQSIVNSTQPIISPAWSPDASKLAYVSFENNKPVVYVQSLGSGRRWVVANFKGSNSAPAWSPDSNRLAVVLTRDGTSQIYTVNSDGTNLIRLTHSAAIDTEPCYAPDGQSIIFTSDRGGAPQIYRVSTQGGEPERLTFEGSYNVSPQFSPDGKAFTFVQRNGGRYQVAIYDLQTRQTLALTDSSADESPSFAPNGKMILYATRSKGQSTLAVVSSDGRIKQHLRGESGEVIEPAWGPFLKNP